MTLKARSSVYFTCTMTIASCLETNNNFNNDLNDLDFFFYQMQFYSCNEQQFTRQFKDKEKKISNYLLSHTF